MRVTRVRDEAKRCLELKAAFFVVSAGVWTVALWLLPADPASGPGHKLLWFWKVHIEIRVSVKTNPPGFDGRGCKFPQPVFSAPIHTHGKIDMNIADGRHWGGSDAHDIRGALVLTLQVCETRQVDSRFACVLHWPTCPTKTLSMGARGCDTLELSPTINAGRPIAGNSSRPCVWLALPSVLLRPIAAYPCKKQTSIVHCRICRDGNQADHSLGTEVGRWR
ncbi:hypothetical protein F5144DRAFT_556205 [Chaetomium tenue]|uniref:Uncharacterized protein n=1 Tax=Chaetomium tenue TaxID=1854479 RepID=A0ACB7PNJ6_9PEZI|nr:hypothetical protein F5144DRAFT_556205 [Chaetomium globosum]